MRNVFSNLLVKAALEDDKVILLTGDHGYALFDEFRATVPNQYINAGVAEQNMVGVAAGLAKSGFKPVVYGLSAFVPVRVLEQIKIDVCYEKLAVLFVGDGAGVVYSVLGTSHQSTEDIAVLRPIPNITIFSPSDVWEMEYILNHALNFSTPAYLRIGKSDIGQVHEKTIHQPIGNLLQVKYGNNNSFSYIAHGSMLKTAVSLAKKNDNPVWSMPSIKPINRNQVLEIGNTADNIVVLEEHSINGGAGSTIAEIICESGRVNTRVLRIGVRDNFSSTCGNYKHLIAEHGLDIDSISAYIEEVRTP